MRVYTVSSAPFRYVMSYRGQLYRGMLPNKAKRVQDWQMLTGTLILSINIHKDKL